MFGDKLGERQHPTMRRAINAFELRELYVQIGAALWHIQYLEDALVSFVVLKIAKERRCAGQTVTMKDAQDLLAETRKLTLGPLIEVCVKRKIVRRNDQPRFEAFKLERHWLVHRSLKDSGDDLYDDEARAVVFRRIESLGQEAKALMQAVFEDVMKWGAAHGVDLAAVNENAEAAIRALKEGP